VTRLNQLLALLYIYFTLNIKLNEQFHYKANGNTVNSNTHHYSKTTIKQVD